VIVLRNVVVKLTLSFLKGAKAPTPKVDKKPKTGAQPALHFGGGEFSWAFDDVIVLIQPWYNSFANGHRYVLFATFLKM